MALLALAEGQANQPFPPLQLTEEAVVGKLCAFLCAHPRLCQAVISRICPDAVSGTPGTEQRKQRRNLEDNSEDD